MIISLSCEKNKKYSHLNKGTNINLEKINFKQTKQTTQHSIIRKVTRTSTKFMKKKNIIQSNRDNFQHELPSVLRRHQTENVGNVSILREKEGVGSYANNNKQNHLNNLNNIRINSTKTSCYILKKGNHHAKNIFKPKKYNEICEKTHSINITHNNNDDEMIIIKNINNESENTNLQMNLVSQTNRIKPLLKKNQLYPERCLIGKNILELEQKNIFSRYQLFNLHSTYKSLLNYSQNSLKKFKKGLGTMLYMNNISLNQSMVHQCIDTYFVKINFQTFIEVYGMIQNILLQQSVIEFIMKLFSEFYRGESIGYIQFYEILRYMIDETQAFELRKLVWEYMGRRESQSIKLGEILELCKSDITLCQRVLVLVGQNNISMIINSQANKNNSQEKGKKCYQTRR